MRVGELRVGAKEAGRAMHVGSFVLAAQFPGQGQGEALHRAVRSAEVSEEAGLDAYEQGFPESLDLLLRWLREPAVAASGERFSFREVAVVPRPSEALTDA